MLQMIYVPLIILSIFVIHRIFGFGNLWKNTNRIRGPKSFPFIGCGYLFFGNSEYIFKQALKLTKKYVSPFQLVFGLKSWFIITDPEQIKIVLCNNITIGKESIYSFFRNIIGVGLVTAETKTWRMHRKLLQPTFAQKNLQTFVSTFQKNSLLLTLTVEKHIDCSEFDLFPYISRASFGNICESSIAISLETKNQEVEEYLNKSRRMLELVFERFSRIWLYPDKIFNFFQISKNTNECINYVRNFTENAIRKRRKIVIASKNWKENAVKTTFLDLILEMGYKFTDKEICDHILTIIIAGFDTTARTINFIFFMLASHPNIQDEVYKEIYSIYGDEEPENEPIKYEDLRHLNYLERVIKETMRLFPAAPIIARHASEEFEMDGCRIAKDSGTGIFILALHRNEKIWPDPLKFDPDRFLPKEINKRHPCSFIPFSYGSRDCIGRVFAMMSMKVMVATFLRKYVLKKDKIISIKDIRLKTDMLLQPVDPLIVRIEKRKV